MIESLSSFLTGGVLVGIISALVSYLRTRLTTKSEDKKTQSTEQGDLIKALLQEREQLMGERQALIDRIASLEEKVQKLTDEISQLKEVNNSRFYELMKEKDALQNLVTKLEAENTELSMQRDALQERCKQCATSSDS